MTSRYPLQPQVRPSNNPYDREEFFRVPANAPQLPAIPPPHRLNFGHELGMTSIFAAPLNRVVTEIRCMSIRIRQRQLLEEIIVTYVNNFNQTQLDLSKLGGGLSQLPLELISLLRPNTFIDARGHDFEKSPLPIHLLPSGCTLLLSRNPLHSIAVIEMLLSPRNPNVRVIVPKSFAELLGQVLPPSALPVNAPPSQPFFGTPMPPGPGSTAAHFTFQNPPQASASRSFDVGNAQGTRNRFSQQTAASGRSLGTLSPIAGGLPPSDWPSGANRARNLSSATLPPPADTEHFELPALALYQNDKVRIAIRYLMDPRQPALQYFYLASYRTMFAMFQAAFALQSVPGRPDVATRKSMFFSLVGTGFSAAHLGTTAVSAMHNGLAMLGKAAKPLGAFRMRYPWLCN